MVAGNEVNSQVKYAAIAACRRPSLNGHYWSLPVVLSAILQHRRTAPRRLYGIEGFVVEDVRGELNAGKCPYHAERAASFSCPNAPRSSLSKVPSIGSA
jgi:hypothetical protein